MKLLPLFALVLFGFLATQVSRADDSPVVFDKAFSADEVITTKDGQTLSGRIYTDSSKVRSEMVVGTMKVIAILRPDQQKMYSVMDAQKMVMEMPYDAAKFKDQMAAATGVEGKFDKLGTEAIDGVDTTKYSVTSKDGNMYYIWADANKLPVKMQAADGTFTMLWKNYVAGPQASGLFEPPPGYQLLSMPSMPDMSQLPGGGAK